MTSHFIQRFAKLFFYLIAALWVYSCRSTQPQPRADLILLNGNLFTADARYAGATAIAVSGDTILAVGSDEAIAALKTEQTRVIDLQGRFVMPGLIEGHGHFIGLGESMTKLNLLHTRSWEEILNLVAAEAQKAKPGEWVEGRGWHQEKWNSLPGRTVNGYPYHDALSALTPDHPVVLYHASGHALMANAKAMELAGVSRETPDPVGGHIVRDAKGLPIGVFEEDAAMNLIRKPYETWLNRRPESQKVEELENNVAQASAACLQHGITSFQDAGSNFWELAQFRRMADEGHLPIRLWAMISQPTRSDFHRLGDFPQIGLAGRHFTVRAVKAYFDGALGSYGAWLLAPYNDNPGFTGQNTGSIDSIALVAGICREKGLQLCVHAIGDRANREMLHLFEQNNAKSLRWRMEHAQHIDTADIPRFAQLGVIASMQAIHCTSDAPFVVKRLGEFRARTGAYAWRSLLDSGAHLANGTDAPVEEVDPLPCIYAAVTRKRADSGLEFFPEQKMTREEALLSYTLWNAYAAFEENEKGSLSPGKLADITVFSKDLLRCPPEEILETEVWTTIVGGKILYEKK